MNNRVRDKQYHDIYFIARNRRNYVEMTILKNEETYSRKKALTKTR